MSQLLEIHSDSTSNSLTAWIYIWLFKMDKNSFETVSVLNLAEFFMINNVRDVVIFCDG